MIAIRNAATAAMAMLAVAVLDTGAQALAASGPKGHKHDTFDAGSPGDPKKPFRVVEIKAAEGNGSMSFDPPRLEVKAGEQIKFVIRNVGELAHEFMLGTEAGNKTHAAEMQKNPDMKHEDANGRSVEPKSDVELLWRFTKAGTFEYACLIPGHYEAGMKGTVTVRSAANAKPASRATSDAKHRH